MKPKNHPDLSCVLEAIGNSVKEIATHIHTVDLGKVGTVNAFGEEQLALDMLSNKIVQDHLTRTGLVALMASEEMEQEIRLPEGRFSVVFDPLDGSSLVDVNLAVGTIFGVYEGGQVVGRKGREMIAAGFAVYGPRTTLVISHGEGVNEYRLVRGEEPGVVEWVLARQGITVKEGKMFAPGNLRAVCDRADYLELVRWWMEQGYTLRYSGGMVPDINQILLKGKGIFSYPGYSEAPQGKLRLLFECAPMAYLLEQAGGAGSDGTMPILDKTIESIHQRTPVYLGSKEEVRRCEEKLGNWKF